MKKHTIFSQHIDGKALSQFYDALKQDCAVQGALMADAHAGYSLPIGAVVATDGMIFPSWVGFDIGCGVAGVKTTFKKADVIANQKAIFDEIYKRIPTGFDVNYSTKTKDWDYRGPMTKTSREIFESGRNALCSLGSGNHYIEIGFDETDSIWISIHSGSRGVGHKIATHYMKLASNSDKASEGHHGLKVDSEIGQDYLMDLNFGLAFALENRSQMIERVEASMASFIDGKADYRSFINRNHNHAEKNKDGLWIHRKGATHAEEGMDGIIPGSMRDGVFIVTGKGNPDSLCSSSHGAGRVMGRAEAKRKLDLETFRAEMAERGIQALVNESTLDESAGAYKDIFQVMADQADLVTVRHHVKPLINIKSGLPDVCG